MENEKIESSYQTDNDYNENESSMNKSTDFLNVTHSVFKQMFEFAGLKRLNVGAAVLWGVTMCPFFLVACALRIVIAVYTFVFKMLTYPGDYLHNCLENDSSNKFVKVVIYLVGYPAVMISRIVGAAMCIVFFLMHFIMNICCYVYSFGGVTFHPYLFDKGYEDKENYDDEFSTWVNVVVYVVTILILMVIIFSIILSGLSGISVGTQFDATQGILTLYGSNSYKVIRCTYVEQIMLNPSSDISKIVIKGKNDDFYVKTIEIGQEYKYNPVHNSVVIDRDEISNTSSIYLVFRNSETKQHYIDETISIKVKG